MTTRKKKRVTYSVYGRMGRVPVDLQQVALLNTVSAALHILTILYILCSIVIQWCQVDQTCLCTATSAMKLHSLGLSVFELGLKCRQTCENKTNKRTNKVTCMLVATSVIHSKTCQKFNECSHKSPVLMLNDVLSHTSALQWVSNLLSPLTGDTFL